jgi:hypothetical protein
LAAEEEKEKEGSSSWWEEYDWLFKCDWVSKSDYIYTYLWAGWVHRGLLRIRMQGHQSGTRIKSS